MQAITTFKDFSDFLLILIYRIGNKLLYKFIYWTLSFPLFQLHSSCSISWWYNANGLRYFMQMLYKTRFSQKIVHWSTQYIINYSCSNFSDNLNIFKKRLKTFLFNCAYNWLFRGRKWSSMSLYLRTLWHVK